METSLIGKALDFGSNEYGFDPRVSNLYYNSYAYVVNHLNLAITRKKLKIRLKRTRRTLELVRALSRIGYLSNYTITRSSSVKNLQQVPSFSDWIYINSTFYKHTSFFKGLRLVSTPSKKHTVTLKALQVINLSIKSSLLILSTPYGIIDHKEALRIKTGGIILCVAS